MVDDFYHFLRADDYAWVTAELAARVLPRGGRIVSVLAGGYSLHTPPAAAPATAKKNSTRSKAAAGAPPPPDAAESAAPVADPHVPAGALPGDGGLAKGVLAHIGALAAAAAAHP